MEDRPTAEFGEDLTILMLGTTSLTPDLAGKLEGLGADVELARVRHAAAAVVAVAPDLVVLVGDAAIGGGKRVCELLAADPAASVAPVAVVGAPTAPATTGLKHGPVAALSGALDADEMAARLVALARDVPEREGAVRGGVSSGTLEPLLESLSEGHRSGVLTVDTDQLPAPARMLIKGGRPVSERPERFVERVKPLLDDADIPAEYEFQQSSTGVDSIPPAVAQDDAPLSMLKGYRVAVVDSDQGRAAQLARALRGRGALAVACVDATSVDQVRGLDPDVVLVDPEDMQGACSALMDTLMKDVRVRWASILAAPRSDLWPQGATRPLISAVCNKISELMAPARELAERLRIRPQFTTRLELLGPARILRVLAAANRTLRMSVRHPRATLHVDLKDGLVCGASGTAKEAPQRPLTGPEVLSALAVMRSGRVTVESRQEAELHEINARVDLALAMADLENPPMAPSLAPQHQVPFPGENTPGAPTPVAFVGLPNGRDASSAALGAAEPPVRGGVPVAPTPRVSAPTGARGPRPAAVGRKATMLGLGHSVPVSAGAHGAQGAALAPAPESEALDGYRPSIPTLDVDLEPIVSQVPSEQSVIPELRSAEFEAVDSGDLELAPDMILRPPAFSSLKGAGRAAVQKLAAGSQRFAAAAQMLGAAVQRFGSLRTALASRLAMAAALRPMVSRRALILTSACAVVLLVGLSAWLLTDGEPQANSGATETAGAERVAMASAPTGVQAAQERASAQTQSAASGSAAGPATSATTTSPSVEQPSDVLEEPDLPPDRLRAWRLKRARKLVQEATKLRRRKRLGMAEASYLKALTLWPNYPLAIAGVVRVHLERRDGVEALRWAERLVTMKPNRSNHHLLHGDALALNGKMDGARKAWRRSARYGNRRAKKRLRGE